MIEGLSKTDQKLYKRVNDILTERGSTFEDWLRLQMKTLVKHSRLYGVNDPISFGKYDGEKMRTIITSDPEYVAWCLRTVAGFTLSPEALQLLSDMGVDL